jgi:hypothetical protein
MKAGYVLECENPIKLMEISTEKINQEQQKKE